MTEYIEAVRLVPIFDTLPADQQLTPDDIYKVYDSYPDNPRERLAKYIKPLIDALLRTDGCKAATKWQGYKKFGRCRSTVAPGFDVCMLHGGPDQKKALAEAAKQRKIAKLEQQLKELRES